MPDTVTVPVVAVSEAALAQILVLRAHEAEDDALGLRVAITGARGAEYTYDLSFGPLAEAGDDDVAYEQGALTLLVPQASVDALQGATLDVPRDPDQGGLVLRNPNKPDPLAGVNLVQTGPLAERVQELLTGEINPALAAHGGFATLAGVDGDLVYVNMGGGCQGCAISALTLRGGIRRTIMEKLPEVADVIDVTDHDAGQDPFYR